MSEELELQQQQNNIKIKMTREEYKNSIASKPFAISKLLEWQARAWFSKAPILLLTGSAGGGKSFIAAHKIHYFALKYPGATCVVVRKNRSIMTNSTVLYLQRTVIKTDKNTLVNFLPSKFRFEYQNGSVLSYAGMDDEKQREHFKSIGQRGGIDFLWIEEGTALDEPDFDMCLSRMRGNITDWTQIIITTNPDAPTHFIKKRLIDAGEAEVILSSADKNYYNPSVYVDTLQSLKGLMKSRLAEGQWLAASGTVYGDVWIDKPGDPASNVTGDAEYIPDGGQIIWGCDDGYAGESDNQGYFTKESHPLIILFAQLRKDGTIAVFDELGDIKQLHRTMIEKALDKVDHEGDLLGKPQLAVVDKSASKFKAELENYGIKWANGAASVIESVKYTQAAIGADANGRKRVIVHPRCKMLRMEMASYVWGDNGMPEKYFDHLGDSLRYICYYLRNTKLTNESLQALCDIRLKAGR